jgi:hypothetical protein
MPENRTEQDRTRDDAGRFLPGRSGNPGGRPARASAWKQAIHDGLDEADVVAVFLAMVEAAKRGEVAAARLVLEYTCGKPVTPVDMYPYQECFKAIDKDAFDAV